MTIGVGYRTNTHFVCFTDVQLVDHSTSLRYNTSKKMIALNFGQHHGILYCAGHGDITDAAFISATTLANHYHNDINLTLDSFVDALVISFRYSRTKREQNILFREKDRIATQQQIFDEETQKQEYAAEQFEKLMEKVKKDREETESSFRLACYDGLQRKPRIFSIDDEIPEETFDPAISVGIGKDAAEVYFSAFGRQLYSNRLSVPDILSISAGAYNFSTNVRDVEGTPHICIIDSKETRILPHEESAILTNASAAHLYDLLPCAKEKAYCTRVYAALLQSQKQRKKTLKRIATDFITTTGLQIDITLASIKLNTWGEIAAQKQL